MLVCLEQRGGIPVAGVIPYMHLQLEDEDSLSDKFERQNTGLITIGVIRLPHISNFTDFDAFEQVEGLAVHYISGTNDVFKADCLIIPGSKNTIADMKWLKETGLEAIIQKYAAEGNPIIGICGGYQMLGEKISDPLGVECGGEISGLGLLKLETVLSGEKHTKQVGGRFEKNSGMFSALSDAEYEGYEIHMGKTVPIETDAAMEMFTAEGSGYCSENVYGTYVHGVFDRAEIIRTIAEVIAKRKGIDLRLENIVDYKALKELEYDKLAATMREYMDMDLVYKMIGVEKND